MLVSRTMLLLVALIFCTASGCSMCCGVYDYMYPTFGGKYERVDPEYGRVGSIYSDPLADPGIPAITHTDVPVEPREPINLELNGDGNLELPVPGETPSTDGVTGSGSDTTRSQPNYGRWR